MAPSGLHIAITEHQMCLGELRLGGSKKHPSEEVSENGSFPTGRGGQKKSLVHPVSQHIGARKFYGFEIKEGKG